MYTMACREYRPLGCTFQNISMVALEVFDMIDWLIHYAKLWAPWWAYSAIAYLNLSLSYAAAVAACVVVS